MLPLATADTIVLSIVRVCNLIPLTEPEAPPQYVTTVVLSSTEVSWEEIPAINHSGTITMYEVQYVPLNNLGEKIFTNTVNVTNTSMLLIVLTGLEEYVEYNISVRAYTSTGPGPYSIGVVGRTDTDSELKNKHSMILLTVFTCRT